MCEGCCNFAKFKFSEGFLLGRIVAQQGSFAKPANLAQIAVPEPRPGFFGCCFRCGWGRWLAHGASRAPTLTVRLGWRCRLGIWFLYRQLGLGLARSAGNQRGCVGDGSGRGRPSAIWHHGGVRRGPSSLRLGWWSQGGQMLRTCPPSTTRAGWPSRQVSNLSSYFSRVLVCCKFSTTSGC